MEKAVNAVSWDFAQTGVRFSSSPPKTEASNSYSSGMSSRLSIDWGTPRRSPFRYMRQNALFCVLSGFKPEEVLCTLRAFSRLKTRSVRPWAIWDGQVCISLSLDAVVGYRPGYMESGGMQQICSTCSTFVAHRFCYLLRKKRLNLGVLSTMQQMQHLFLYYARGKYKYLPSRVLRVYVSNSQKSATSATLAESPLKSGKKGVAH